MNVLYCRISTAEQKTDRQRVNEKNYSLVIEDKCSGTIHNDTLAMFLFFLNKVYHATATFHGQILPLYIHTEQVIAQ